jgi:hypothetical protein
MADTTFIDIGIPELICVSLLVVPPFTALAIVLVWRFVKARNRPGRTK